MMTCVPFHLWPKYLILYKLCNKNLIVESCVLLFSWWNFWLMTYYNRIGIQRMFWVFHEGTHMSTYLKKQPIATDNNKKIWLLMWALWHTYGTLNTCVPTQDVCNFGGLRFKVVNLKHWGEDTNMNYGLYKLLMYKYIFKS